MSLLIAILCTLGVFSPSAHAEHEVVPWTFAAFGGIGSPAQGLSGLGLYRRFKVKFEAGIDISIVDASQSVVQPEAIFNYYLHDKKYSVYVGAAAGKSYAGTMPLFIGPQFGIDYHFNEDLTFGLRGQYLLGAQVLNELMGVKLYFN